MAIFCLATSLEDLKERLGNIVVGYTRDQKPVRARDLKAHGAMTVLLKDALEPNLVQTLENNPAFIHGGPFANIAHGCNSVIATRTALKLADYVVTEAGFGADLGAEKFVDIKCRKSGLRPDGGGDRRDDARAQVPRRRRPQGRSTRRTSRRSRRASPISSATSTTCANHYGLPCVVPINHFTSDTEAEIELLKRKMAHHEAPVVLATHWAEGGKGRPKSWRAPWWRSSSRCQPTFEFVYEDELPLWDKMKAIATKIYGAADITADAKVRAQIKKLQEDGYGHYPVCVAKTQYSFSTDPQPARRAVRARGQHPRSAAGGRRGVRRHGLRRHHDHAGAAQGAVGREDRSDRGRQGDGALLAPRRTGRLSDVRSGCGRRKRLRRGWATRRCAYVLQAGVEGRRRDTDGNRSGR